MSWKILTGLLKFVGYVDRWFEKEVAPEEDDSVLMNINGNQNEPIPPFTREAIAGLVRF